MAAQDQKTKTQPMSSGIGSVTITQLFKVMVENGASDLHLSIGTPPAMRVHGEIMRVKIGNLTGDDTRRLTYQILSEKQRKELEEECELDFSFGVKGLARFRANVFHAKGGISAVFRQIPSIIPDFDSLGLPKILLEMINAANGLVLVTGPTGSGKSTTLAALIDYLNKNEPAHIVTLEDPIEFVHSHRTSVVNQREVGQDTKAFARGLKSLLRQDPDIVLIGELRDLETIEAALTIAETGHLVFATLHTNSCVQTINRVVNVFSGEDQDRIRTLLSFVLQGIIAQQLLPNSYEQGRSLALEILRPNSAIRNLIREDKVHQVYSQMQVGQEKTGMTTMNQSLQALVNKGKISREVAMEYSTVPEELGKALGLNKDF